MSSVFTSDTDAPATEIHILRPKDLDAALDKLSKPQAAFARATGFGAQAGDIFQVPGEDGDIAAVLFGAGEPDPAGMDVYLTGVLPTKLPSGTYKIVQSPDDWPPHLMAMSWAMGAYQFTAYQDKKDNEAQLLLDDDAMRPAETAMMADLIYAGRDLVNMPAGDLGPEALHQVAASRADTFGAKFEAIVGDDLLEQNYPMIHAVGRAAAEAPRLLRLEWGNPDHPSLTLTGKGITYDTGGLNIKGGASMRYMKKDMGGSAHALTLGSMIMASKLPVHLTIYLAVADNAISGNAFRPGDILESRAGISVEIDNTDAEGRLVLSDALCRAAEEEPDLMINFATLTGAARVALGPTLPPIYFNRDELAPGVLKSARDERDPLWHMPLWQPYNRYLDCPVADMKNAGGRYAGSVTAALFLERFVKNRPWMHLDVFAWNPTTEPSRPVGGEMQCIRGLYHWLKDSWLK